MNTQYYKVMPIDVLPEEVGVSFTAIKFNGDFFRYLVRGEEGWLRIPFGVTHWLKPITLTIQELLSTEEGKEIVREIFNAPNLLTVWGKDLYPTADDFIKTNTAMSNEKQQKSEENFMEPIPDTVRENLMLPGEKQQKSEEERIREIIVGYFYGAKFSNSLEEAAKQIYTEIIEPKDKRIAELEKENEKNHLNLKQ
jgi:cell division protein YceG involved in septum cleavage